MVGWVENSDSAHLREPSATGRNKTDLIWAALAVEPCFCFSVIHAGSLLERQGRYCFSGLKVVTFPRALFALPKLLLHLGEHIYYQNGNCLQVVISQLCKPSFSQYPRNTIKSKNSGGPAPPKGNPTVFRYFLADKLMQFHVRKLFRMHLGSNQF